jgi:hypothetical protein
MNLNAMPQPSKIYLGRAFLWHVIKSFNKLSISLILGTKLDTIMKDGLEDLEYQTLTNSQLSVSIVERQLADVLGQLGTHVYG